jgi:hypothetical protein
MRATSLDNAINNFNELQPLVFGQDKSQNVDPSASPEFYVERPDNTLAS